MTFAATTFEYRFRYALHTVLFVLAFVAPWTWITALHLSHESSWLVVAGELSSANWLSFHAATILLLALATVCTILAAWLRTWGTAYLSAGVVHSSNMHDQGVISDGPFRYTRNPLYLGTFLFALALCLLMPPSGAVFAILTIGLLQLRLIFAEEPFLLARLGAPYAAYCARVPRLLPSPTAQIAARGRTPHWTEAALGETMFIGVAACYVFFCAAICLPSLDWPYNAWLLTKCVVVCLGLSLVARALLPRTAR